MDFTTGTSIWEAQDNSLPGGNAWPQSPLVDDLSCEVAVVGGGISGAMTAHELVKSGMSVILVDRDDFGAQSTAASTGLLMYELDLPLSELIPRVGKDSALVAYRSGLEAIDRIEAMASVHSACEFSRRSTLLMESHPERLRKLEEEYECRKQFGFDVTWLDARALRHLSSIPAAGALRSTGNGQLNPLAYTQHLLAAAVQQGLDAFPRTAVTRVLRQGDRIVLVTRRGRITAKYVVYTTGYRLGTQLGRRIGNLNSTFALSSRPQPRWEGWPDGSLLWETGHPYHYARQTSDGRVLFGGQDTPCAEDHRSPALLAKKAELLVQNFNHWFPNAALEPEFVWAGTFGESDDGMPFIGALPGREREFAAVGYGGNGITFSAIAATMISRLIRGEPDRTALAFRFGR